MPVLEPPRGVVRPVQPPAVAHVATYSAAFDKGLDRCRGGLLCRLCHRMGGRGGQRAVLTPPSDALQQDCCGGPPHGRLRLLLLLDEVLGVVRLRELLEHHHDRSVRAAEVERRLARLVDERVRRPRGKQEAYDWELPRLGRVVHGRHPELVAGVYVCSRGDQDARDAQVSV